MCVDRVSNEDDEKRSRYSHKFWSKKGQDNYGDDGYGKCDPYFESSLHFAPLHASSWNSTTPGISGISKSSQSLILSISESEPLTAQVARSSPFSFGNLQQRSSSGRRSDGKEQRSSDEFLLFHVGPASTRTIGA